MQLDRLEEHFGANENHHKLRCALSNSWEIGARWENMLANIESTPEDLQSLLFVLTVLMQ